ncbi:MAG TPA: hypothetical protein VJS11_01135 [Acidobacteriaceae bacterium]|nr:hypothetical protein [Acidobacteriaceae bacterium]
MRAGWQGMCVVAAAMAVAVSAFGQGSSAQSSRMSPEELKRMESYTHVPPDVKAFAAQYVAAWNAKDMGRLVSLNLPESRACITPATKPVYEQSMRAQWHDPITPDYTLMLMPVNEGNLKAFVQDLHFPVKPERELHIDWQYPGTMDSGQAVVYLVRQNGRWMGDFPCMTAKAIRDFNDDAADREKYKAMAAGIKEPLRGELLAMLQKHQSGEAAERYKTATGCDMGTAMRVIFALDGGMP